MLSPVRTAVLLLCSNPSPVVSTARAQTPTATALDAPDPGGPGPYAVGATRRQLTRASSTSGQPRALDTVIWYPVTMPGQPGPAADTQIDAAPDLSGAPYPVVILSHGWTSRPGNYGLLATHVASFGVVVVGPVHPDCGVPCSVPGAAVGADRREALANRPADLSFVLDQLVLLEGGGDTLLSGLMDTARVGMMGHSTGGWTVLTTAEHDPRFSAVLAMAPVEAPAAWQSMIDEAVSINNIVLIMAGQRDTHVPFGSVERLFQALPPKPTPTWLTVFPHAGHWIYIDFCPTGDPNCGPDRLPEAQGQEIVGRWAAAFLLRHVAGDPRYDAWLDPMLGAVDPEIQVMQR